MQFITFLLDNVEYPPDTDIDEQIPDLFLNLIISFNLQFSSPSDNVVLKALEQRDVAKSFTEKILLLINREGKYFSSHGMYKVGNLLSTTWIFCKYKNKRRIFHMPIEVS